VQNKWTYPFFAVEHSEILNALCHATEAVSEETVSARTGLAWNQIQEVAELLAKSKRGTIIWGEGIIGRTDGLENVSRLIDLALLCGLMEKPGAGVHPICEENNEQGAVDMGGVPEFLPGPIPYQDGKARYEALWNTILPAGVGRTLPEIIEAAERGEIRALYVVGENPLETLPISMKVREAFEKIDLIICQDPFLTEMGKMADYVLPACTYAEKEGTFTNMEGEIHSVRQAFEPIEESRTDLKIFSDLLRQLGKVSYRSVVEVTREMGSAVPSFALKERTVTDSGRMEEYLKSGFVAAISERYLLKGAMAGREDYPMQLVLGQIIYHSGKLSTQDEGLMKIYDKPRLRVSDADAAEMELKTGDWVRVKSEQGAIELAVDVATDLPKGVVWFPEHFGGLKDLMEVEVDLETKVPCFKSGAVSVKKVPLFDLMVVQSGGAAVRTTDESETVAG
jgi:formate dehydrogenase alpha subunit